MTTSVHISHWQFTTTMAALEKDDSLADFSQKLAPTALETAAATEKKKKKKTLR